MSGRDKVSLAFTPEQLESLGQGPAPAEHRKKLVAMCDDGWEHLDAIAKAARLEITIGQWVKMTAALVALKLAYKEVVGGAHDNAD